MMNSMRVAGSSWIMKLLMGLLVVSFAVWGVGDVVRSGNNSHLVKVGDEVISYPEFARSVSMTERVMGEAGITNIPRQALEKQVLQRLVEEKIVEQRLKDSGLAVNRDLLASNLRQAPMLKDDKGHFDPKKFQTLLQAKQVTEATFLGELAADIRGQTFTASLNAQDITPPSALASLYSSAENEQRDAVLITLPPAAAKAAAVDEAALKEYYEANKGVLYMMPERRTLEYVTFSADDVAKRAEKDVTPEAIKDRIASAPEAYAGAEGEKKAHDELLAEAKEHVTDNITIAIEDALAAGDNMAKAVAAAGLSASSRILHDQSAEDIAKSKDPLILSVGKQGFTMLEGETSNLGTTPDGAYFMVNVQQVTAAAAKPFDTVKDDVAKHAAERAQSQALRDEASKLADALKAKDADWQKIAAQFGARGQVVSNLKRGDTNVPAALNEAIFDRDVGEVAGPLVTDNGAQLALVTASHFASTPAKADVKTVAEMGKTFQNELLGSYYSNLLQEYPVIVNQAMMQEIHKQEGDGA